jgi:hypothetical protein
MVSLIIVELIIVVSHDKGITVRVLVVTVATPALAVVRLRMTSDR